MRIFQLLTSLPSPPLFHILGRPPCPDSMRGDFGGGDEVHNVRKAVVLDRSDEYIGGGS